MADELNQTLSGGTESVVAPDSAADANPTGEGGHTGEPAAGDAERRGGEKQTHAFNAAMAAARRKAEAETEERMSRQFDDDIRDQKIPNPSKPGTYFSSMAELREYSALLRRADAEERGKKQGRSAEEIIREDEDRAYLAKLRKQDEASKAEADKKARQQEFIRNDIKAFSEAYPDVDIAALDSNKTFRRFAGSRYGKEPLAELYGDFAAIVGETKAAEAARRTAREDGSTGSGSGGGAGSGRLSSEQKARLEEWNRANPEMKMSEADFLRQG